MSTDTDRTDQNASTKGERRATPASSDDTTTEQGVSISRRNIILTSTTAVLGAVGSSAGAGNVAAQADGVDIDTDDTVGWNYTRAPESLRLDSSSEITVDLTGVAKDEVILVSIEFRPVGGDFEPLAQEGFIYDGNSYTFSAADDLHESERDLTAHSEISYEDLRIDTPIEELDNVARRTVTQSYDIRVSIFDESNNIIGRQTETIEVKYALTGGAGVRLSYNSMLKAPTDQVRHLLDEQSSE